MDLEEAAKNHKSAIHIVSPQWTSEVEKAFKAGAEWQKEQMMKEAVEAVIEEPECLVWRITADLEGDFVVKHNLRDGDKVKVYFIKEE